MSSFTYNWHDLIALNKDILEIVKSYSHYIYILETQKERCVCKDNVEYDNT